MSDSVDTADTAAATAAWRYALYGGLASIPLTFGHYWFSGAGGEFSLTMVSVGGLLAGYLARRHSLDANYVGLRAGVVGAIPVLPWAFVQYLRRAGDVSALWGSPEVAVAFVVLFGAFTVGIGALAGLVGGAIGGWLAKQRG